MWSVERGNSLQNDLCPEWADTLFFDPPWDNFAEPACGFDRFDSILAFTNAKRAGDMLRVLSPRHPSWVFIWDCVSSWYTRGQPLMRHKSCFWFGDLARWDHDGYFRPIDNPKRLVKNPRGSFIAGDSRGKRMSDLYAKPITEMGRQRFESISHSKPIEWIQYLIACTGARGVFDPFAGSGASVLAAHEVGVPALGVEVDPEALAIAQRNIERIVAGGSVDHVREQADIFGGRGRWG